MKSRPTVERKRVVLCLIVLNISLVVLLIVLDVKTISDLNDTGQDEKRNGKVDLEKMFQQPRRRRQLKSILLWNAAERPETGIFGVGHRAFIRNGCPVRDCEIIAKRKYRPLEDFDAIIFNFNDQDFGNIIPPQKVFNRRPTQRLIFLTQEPPVSLTHYDMSIFMQGFNWTMTYRLDSDIPLLYGRVYPKPSTAFSNLSRVIRQRMKTRRPSALIKNKKMSQVEMPSNLKKTKLVAWMVSHCVTSGQREDYVEELSKYIEIDKFGTCNNNTCGQVWSWDSYDVGCYEMIESHYKFYLSFENSLCKDYVTEKFFHILHYRVVPVVYGGANYSYLAPPHSYINARDYSPKNLAAYLQTLAANEKLYEEYFQWKDHYFVEAGVQQMARHGFCDLCRKLHEDFAKKTYTSELVTQWHYRTQCYHNSNLSVKA